jgi:hypothetical protein
MDAVKLALIVAAVLLALIGHPGYGLALALLLWPAKRRDDA